MSKVLYDKLAGIAAGAEVNVQADWNAATGDAAILNKPTLAPANAEANVRPDWNAVSGDASIASKPVVMPVAEARTGTATTERTMTAAALKAGVDAARGSVLSEGPTWFTSPALDSRTTGLLAGEIVTQSAWTISADAPAGSSSPAFPIGGRNISVVGYPAEPPDSQTIGLWFIVERASSQADFDAGRNFVRQGRTARLWGVGVLTANAPPGVNSSADGILLTSRAAIPSSAGSPAAAGAGKTVLIRAEVNEQNATLGFFLVRDTSQLTGQAAATPNAYLPLTRVRVAPIIVSGSKGDKGDKGDPGVAGTLATTTAAGVVEKATTAEMAAGTADKYPDAAEVKAYADGLSGGVTKSATAPASPAIGDLWSNTATGVLSVRHPGAASIAARTRDPSKDLSTTLLRSAARGISPTGITTDGTTIWVADWATFTAWAFTIATRARARSKDLSTTLLRSAASAIVLGGITTDGTTIWVLDTNNNAAWAFTIATQARDLSKDLSATLLRSAASNIWPRGIATDGTTIWVADNRNNAAWAFTIATQARDPSKDLSATLLRSAASSIAPIGITTDGTTIWVADNTNTATWAFTIATQARDPSKDLSRTILRSAASNIHPVGIATDGTTIWVADSTNNAAWAFRVTASPAVPEWRALAFAT